MSTPMKIVFGKGDVNLWGKHCPWITAQQFQDGLNLRLATGRVVSFGPARGVTCNPCLTPRPSLGLADWNDLKRGAVVEATLVETE